jgi:hypothetical protein
MDPATAQSDAAVSRPVEQIFAKQRSNIGQDLLVASRVKPVAPEVQALAGFHEATGIAARYSPLLEHLHVGAIQTPELVRRADPRRTGAQDGDPG